MESKEISKIKEPVTVQIADNEIVSIPLELLQHSSTLKAMLEHRKAGLIKNSSLQIPTMDKKSWDMIAAALNAVDRDSVSAPFETPWNRDYHLFYYCDCRTKQELLTLITWGDLLDITPVLKVASQFKRIYEPD